MLEIATSWVSSLEPLQGCTNLTVLVLQDCPSISSLEPLRSCSRLTELDLRCCTSILSLEPLQGCPRLTMLDLEDCEAGNLPGLEHLRGLPNLEISGI